jgi:hypothetical protein
MPLDGLGNRELFTGCEGVQERVRARGQQHGARLVAGIAPGRTHHRVQLLPLGGVQEPVAPLLELLGGRVIARGGLVELRPHPPVHHGNISLSNLVTWSWHTAPPKHSVSISRHDAVRDGVITRHVDAAMSNAFGQSLQQFRTAVEAVIALAKRIHLRASAGIQQLLEGAHGVGHSPV